MARKSRGALSSPTFARYAHKKGKQAFRRDQIYVSNIKSNNLTQDQLKMELMNHFQEFGPIDSIQVNLNSKTGQLYAFVKFSEPEHAYRAIKSSTPFLSTE